MGVEGVGRVSKVCPKHFPCQTGVQSCTKRDNPNTLNLIVMVSYFPWQLLPSDPG